MEVYSLKCDEKIEDEQYDFLLSIVSYQKLKRIKQFRFIEDAKRTLYGEAMVRYLICNYLNLQNKDLNFGSNQYGKPFLYNNSRFFFNISHSANWVVCAISVKEVGIDIEQIVPIDLSIAKHFFCEKEYSYIMSATDYAIQLERFYNLWTIKESYVKHIGQGLNIPLNSFCVYKREGEFKILFNELGNMQQDIFFSQFDLEHNYKLSVCSQEIEHSKCIKQIKLTDIICSLCK